MTMKRRVFVTGASGAIGRAVTVVLLRAGHEVMAVSRSTPAADARTPGLRYIVGDILDHERLRAHIAEADVVCHLAALIPPRFDDAAYASSCFETNSLATHHLASIACGLGKRFIYSSSGSIYVPSAEPAAETSPVYPAARAPYYLGSKLLGEIYVEHLRLRQGFDSVIFRVGSAYGPGVANSVITTFVSNAMAGKPLTVMHGGQACADFVYVEDLARLFLAAVEGRQTGIFNAGSGAATSIAALAGIVSEIYAEFNPAIELTRGEGTPPPGFAALAMDRTNKAFAHTPSPLRSGLQRMKEALAGLPSLAMD